jgi:hypothetical protein
MKRGRRQHSKRTPLPAASAEKNENQVKVVGKNQKRSADGGREAAGSRRRRRMNTGDDDVFKLEHVEEVCVGLRSLSCSSSC